MVKNIRNVVVGSSMIALAVAGVVSAADDAKMKDVVTYQVKITNMTEGQPLSPPVVASHSPDMHVWEEGEKASKGVQMIAEDGKTDKLVEELKGKATDIAAAKMEEKIMPGKSMTMMIKCKPGDVISAVTMLAATNDGFTGLDGCQAKDGEMKEAMAYDGGTEENTEKKSDVPAPSMGKGRAPTEPQQPIQIHPGITGQADLDKEKMGWDGPVAKFQIKKM